jgi:hypothetical protein
VYGARQQLLTRILSSRYFEHAHAQSAVLRYLVERSCTSTVPPKEYEIGVNALGRPATFDPRISPIVRVLVAGVRERLAAYFHAEGRWEPCHLTIPKGGYQVVFQDAVTARVADAAAPYKYAALEQFWRPHLVSTGGNILVYTEPLFFRDDQGHYFRDPDVNDIPTAERVLGIRAPGMKFGPMRVTYGCLWTGEVHCMLSIIRMFRELGAPLEIRTPRICAWAELKQTSLVLLGNSRTNSILKSFELDSPFRLHAHTIENRKPKKGERRLYRGSRSGGPALERMTTYALVTRRPAVTSGNVVTMIAADHCRAIEGAGYYLTHEEKVHDLLERTRLRNALMPPYLQLLIRVETVDTTREIVDVDCVAHRIWRDRRCAGSQRSRAAPRRSSAEGAGR